MNPICLGLHIVVGDRLPFELLIERRAHERCVSRDSELVESHSISKRRLYCCDFLFRLLPEIKSLFAKYGQNLTTPEYALIFQDIMVFWVDKIVGRRPAPDAGAAQLKRIELWRCACGHCGKVRAFMRDEPERSKTWTGIGFKVRQHLEKELKRHCWDAASWEVVYSSPQGIKVRPASRIVSACICRQTIANNGE